MVNLSTISKLLDSFTDNTIVQVLMRILENYNNYRTMISGSIDQYITNYTTLQTFANDGSETTDITRRGNAIAGVVTQMKLLGRSFDQALQQRPDKVKLYPRTAVAILDEDCSFFTQFALDNQCRLVEDVKRESNFVSAMGKFGLYNSRISNGTNMAAITGTRLYAQLHEPASLDFHRISVTFGFTWSTTTISVRAFLLQDDALSMWTQTFNVSENTLESFVSTMRSIASSFNTHLQNGDFSRAQSVDGWTYNSVQITAFYPGIEIWTAGTNSFVMPAAQIKENLMLTHDALSIDGMGNSISRLADRISDS